MEPLAELVMRETGLPWKEGIGGTKSMTTMLRYYAGLADRVELVERRTGLTGVTASIEKVPLGVVAQIVPWNGPISMASPSLPPALLAGCTVVLKPSELTPLSAGYLADAALTAGLPPGVLNVIPALPAQSDTLVRHPGVNKIAFTGVSPRSRVGQEEIFAPVMVVFTYTSEEEALQIVNDTEYGLNDAVYSANPDRALAIARRMQSGTVSINNGQARNSKACAG